MTQLPNSGERFRQKAEERYSEEYIIDQRNSLVETHADRLDRLEQVDRLYRGEWMFLEGDEATARVRNPKTMNQVQVELDDIARMTAENTPSIRIPPKGDSKKAEEQANVREAVCHGYWKYNRGDMLVPSTAMDLAGAGMAAWLPYVKPGFDYPALVRLDPRSCYPSVINGQLTDLVHITKLKNRQLRALTGVELPVKDDAWVELIAYYDDEVAAELAYGGGKKYQWIKPPREHGLKHAGRGLVPVAFAQLDSFDGAYRGMFDQMGGALEAKNRIVELYLRGLAQQVFAPIKEFGVENGGDYGPFARIILEGPDSVYEQMTPSTVNPQVFGMLQVLGDETRSAGGYPAQRQGADVGSILSGAGITASQSQMTTNIRNIQRLIASLREQANRIMFALDETVPELNKRKALCRSVGGKTTYTPSTDIAGEYENEVVYGAGAGLDKANQYVLALQLKGAGLVSDETIMGELSEVTDPVGEKDRIVREQMDLGLVQKFAQEAPLPMMMQARLLMGEGKSFLEAMQELLPQAQQQQAAQQQAEAPQAQTQMPEGVSPEDMQAAATSLQQGGVPGQAPAQSQLENIVPDTSTVTLIGR